LRDVTILAGAIEKGGRFVPLSACEMALARKESFTLKGRIHDHDFS
jgi:hypothetical protein